MSSMRNENESDGNPPDEGFQKKVVVEVGVFFGLAAAPLAIALLVECPDVSVRELVRRMSATDVLKVLGGVFMVVELVRLVRRSLPKDPVRRRKTFRWFFVGFAIPFLVLAVIVLACRFL